MNDNIDKMRRSLLEETNYRCGYCMRNVTPKVYYLNDNPHPHHDYEIYDYVKGDKISFYNISERAHIIPQAEVKDEYKDFYNLITLCKICHYETDKAGMLGNEDERKNQLRRLKLHWMISSGRFSRLELDCLMNLYNEYRVYYIKYPVDIGTNFIYKQSDKIKFSKPISLMPVRVYRHNPINTIIKDGEITTIKSKTYNFYLESNYYMSFIFYNILNCEFAIHTEDFDVMTNNTRIGILPGFITITCEGYNFAEKFYEVYKDNF